MNKIPGISIRKKLIMIIMAVSVTGLLLSAFAFISFINYRAGKNLRQHSLAEAVLIADRSSAALLFDDSGLAQANLDALRLNPAVTGACMYDGKGAVFAVYGAYGGAEKCPPWKAGRGESSGKDRLLIFEPVLAEGGQIGSVFIATSLKELISAKRDVLLTSCAIILLLSILVFYISTRLEGLISRPLIHLTKTARLVASRKNYDIHAEKSSQDEIGELVDAFNEMLDTIRAKDEENKKLNAELEERVLMRTAQLELANKEMEAFSYSVSHDLRAPLRHISGFVALLVSRFGPALPEKGMRYLKIIEDSVRQMGILIDELLQFSRSGRVEMKKSAVDMNAIFQEALAPLRGETSGREVEWEIGRFPRVFCDGVLVKQVWANLLGNAVKFSPARGKKPK
ncbi:MAG: hypothetical protein COT17_04875 [Elusimicrobia bacterium CG08_land_8_20_14_0_20_51_18]|nr:MAG: hypothetical protein COT17_04875 [Elusimicrobia bacterium CG08_land_8_20_14_0_20_51_18]